MVPISGLDNMSEKLDTVMEVSPTVMENGNSVMENGNSVIKLPEEKMMICASNCEDNAFDDDAVKAPEEKLMMMTCANNSEDNSFHMEVSPSSHNGLVACEGNIEDGDVNIVDHVNLDEDRVALAESRDVTESSSSSSFGCTDSGDDNAVASNDVEVESQVRDSNSSLVGFEGFSESFKARKKKVTAHWRKFIRPLMWRCKWVELQIRELNTQASKYDQELKECERRKQCHLEKLATDELGMKSVPFICQDRSVKLMKRKKRKRVEETVDLASYTSSHTLFSYHASRKRIADSAYMDDDLGNTDVVPAAKTPFGNDEFGANAEWTLLEFKDSDVFESILRKIEETQLQVRHLRVRMDKVVREHPGDFVSDKSCFATGDASAPSSVLPNVNSEKIALGSMCTSQQTSEKKLDMPESESFGHGDATPVLDMVESSERPQGGGKREKMENEILITNQPVKEELNITKEVGIQQHNAESQSIEGKVGHPQHVPDPNSTGEMPATQDQPPMKILSISKLTTPKNKRKRGRRKARSGRWNRRSSG